MDRRTLLSSSGAVLAGASGCLSTFADGSPSTADRSPTSTASSTNAPSAVSITLDALQPAVLYLADDAIYVREDSGQYLFLAAETSDDRPPPRDDFSFHFAGETFAPFDDPPTEAYRLYDDHGYAPEEGGGLLLFELPETGPAADARLSWPGGEWRPDSSLLGRLEAPDPSFSLSATFPATVSVGEAPTVSLTVTNEGDLPGRFVAGLNRSGPRIAYLPVEHVSVLVPAGQTVTHEVTDDELEPMDSADAGDGEPDLTYHLDRVDGDLTRKVRLVE